MKGLKLSLMVLAAIFLALGFSGMAYAFHSGGVAECEGCHTMHNSLNGDPLTKNTPVGAANNYLLIGSDASSTCLNCHAADASSPGSYHIMTYPVPGAGSAPVNNSPGGDFAWLQKDYSWIPRGTNPANTENSYGYQHGHNIYAADFGLVGDGRFSFAPGSQNTYSAGGTFGCQSCHDPHGRYRILDTTGTISTTGLPIKSSGSYGVDPTNGVYAVGVYRLLGGIGYVPKSYSGGPAFSQDPMFAAAPSNYNQTETSYYGTRVAYGKNSSEWCANCHRAMHQNLSNVTNAIVHPAGEHILGPEISDNYNKYVYTGLTNGVQANAFLSLVPFQVGNLAQNSLLKAYQGRDNGGASNGASYTLGTTSSDRPTCLSCHKAHASAFDSISRWSNGNEFLTVGNTTGVVSYPDPTANPGQAMGRSLAETQAAYGGRVANVWAAPYQRSLCNKCHVKD